MFSLIQDANGTQTLANPEKYKILITRNTKSDDPVPEVLTLLNHTPVGEAVVSGLLYGNNNEIFQYFLNDESGPVRKCVGDTPTPEEQEQADRLMVVLGRLFDSRNKTEIVIKDGCFVESRLAAKPTVQYQGTKTPSHRASAGILSPERKIQD